MTYFIIALIAFAIGFILGLRSKAQAKIKRRESTKQGNVYVKDRANLPGHRQAPPPPPVPRIIREGEQPPKPLLERDLFLIDKKRNYVRPGYGYDKGTFASVNKCSNCHAIGYEYDMHTVNPCPKCGGKVKGHGAAKWVGDRWEMSKA